MPEQLTKSRNECKSLKCDALGEVKEIKKTQKYGPLMWEMRERNPGYQVKQYNIIIDVLEGCSSDVSHAAKELVGEGEYHSLTKNAEICHIEYTKHCPQFQILA